jgi:hypothetical protein
MAARRISASIWTRLAVVAVFAVAMAYLEAAVVVYLREIFHITGELLTSAPRVKDTWFSVPYLTLTLLRPNALLSVLPQSRIATIEVAREAATIVMLACVGWLGGRTLRARAAFFLAAFGAWDIGYYAFLRLLVGWPGTLKSLDVLFLIPGPWVAPVFVPVAISSVMIVGAVLMLRGERA